LRGERRKPWPPFVVVCEREKGKPEHGYRCERVRVHLKHHNLLRGEVISDALHACLPDPLGLVALDREDAVATLEVADFPGQRGHRPPLINVLLGL
jgi:hypothetical protein